jgi:hypothetical protein
LAIPVSTTWWQIRWGVFTAASCLGWAWPSSAAPPRDWTPAARGKRRPDRLLTPERAGKSRPDRCPQPD